MIHNQIGHGIDEEWMIVGGGGSANFLCTNFGGQLIAVLNVEFVQRFDVFVYKCNRYDDEVLFALFDVALHIKRIVLNVQGIQSVSSVPFLTLIALSVAGASHGSGPTFDCHTRLYGLQHFSSFITRFTVAPTSDG